MSRSIRIIFPCGPIDENKLVKGVKILEQKGFRVSYKLPKGDSRWPFTSAPLKERLAELTDALLDSEVDYLLAARGGYGASDLLPHLAWHQFEDIKPKLIIGFSDVSALQCGFYRKLGWKALHAPMPATGLWQEGKDQEVKRLIDLLEAKTTSGSITLLETGQNSQTFQGELFGGCLSVLTNLIGTPYGPGHLAGKILFFEDISENPARLIRYWNQWIQSGLLEGVNAVVFGKFSDLGSENEAYQGLLRDELSQRTDCSVYFSEDFGHQSPNEPLMIGGQAKISERKLTWNDPGEKTDEQTRT